MSKLDLKEILAAVDLGARDMWKEISDDQRASLKKEFFILNRFISNVSIPKERWQKGKRPTRDEIEHFVIFVNEFYNKHWNTLQKHPELLWNLLCMCSHDSKEIFFHEFIKFQRKTKNKIEDFLSDLYPDKKQDEIEMLAKINSLDDIKNLAKDTGLSDKEISKLF